MDDSAAKEIQAEPELRFRFVGDPGPIFAGLAKAWLDFGPILRDKTVRVRPKDTSKAEFEFTYAPLEKLSDATRKPLSDNGLVVLQPYHSTRGGWLVRTILGHSSGSYVEAVDFIASTEKMSNQDLGGTLTFRRRYGYGAMLSLVTEEDDDANAADGNAAVFTRRSPQQPAKSGPRNKSASPANATPAKAPTNITAPPGWPDTDVTNLCNWINSLAPVTAVWKTAWGMLRGNLPLYQSAADWQPVFKTFADRLRHLILEKKIQQRQRDAAFEEEVKAEAERIRGDQVFQGEQPAGGTESNGDANQAG